GVRLDDLDHPSVARRPLADLAWPVLRAGLGPLPGALLAADASHSHGRIPRNQGRYLARPGSGHGDSVTNLAAEVQHRARDREGSGHALACSDGPGASRPARTPWSVRLGQQMGDGVASELTQCL